MTRRLSEYLNPETNVIEVYDEDTGELVTVKPQYVDPTLTLRERAVPVDLPTGERILVDPKTPIPSTWEYSVEAAQKICDELLEGKYLKDICDGKRFPPFKIVMRWKRAHEEFQRMYLEALEDRAEYFGDHIRELADTADEGNVGSRQLQISTYKHLTQVDSKRFQPKQTTQVATQGSQTLVIVTGIVRDDEKEIEAEAKELVESKGN